MHYMNYEEHRRHGTDTFPLEFYSVDSQHPRYQMPFHWHKETELLHIIQGTFQLSLDGVEICLQEGELCYIPGGTLHGGEPVDCLYECIDFDPTKLLHQADYARRYLRRIENGHSAIRTQFTTSEPGILKSATRLFAAAQSKCEGWELLVMAGLFDFYGTVVEKHYYEDVLTRNSNQQKVQQIKTAIEFIETNYGNSISLEDIAQAAGLSPKYFCRYFRMITNRTPIDYLNYYRIEKACYLLEQKKGSITEVAYDCGYNDTSYFIRCFKKYKHTTPYKYANPSNWVAY